MPAKTAFIWDLDGTLLDSYAVIVPALQKALRGFGTELTQEAITREVITSSVAAFLAKTEAKTGVPAAALDAAYLSIADRELLSIRPIRHAPEILRILKDRGASHYVLTHRGASSETLLKSTGLFEYFDEIVTGRDGFPRKPDPAGLLYLTEKHGLDKRAAFYVGDRRLDVECAERAGIPSILYLPEGSAARPTGREKRVVKDLLEIEELLPPREDEVSGRPAEKERQGMRSCFESERIRFVEVSERLVPDYLAMVNDYEHVGRPMGGPPRSYTEEQEILWVRGKLAEKALVFSLLEKRSGAFIGNIELMNLTESEGELGIAFTAAMQDRGFGSEAVAALARFAAGRLGLKRLVLRTHPDNARAIHVYEKCGFREIGRTEEHVTMEKPL